MTKIADDFASIRKGLKKIEAGPEPEAKNMTATEILEGWPKRMSLSDYLQELAGKGRFYGLDSSH